MQQAAELMQAAIRETERHTPPVMRLSQKVINTYDDLLDAGLDLVRSINTTVEEIHVSSTRSPEQKRFARALTQATRQKLVTQINYLPVAVAHARSRGLAAKGTAIELDGEGPTPTTPHITF